MIPAMDLTGTRVTVVGAGIGGMAAALLFARLGAGVAVLERSADIRAVGAGLLLQPNGLAVLSALGVDGPLRAAGHAVAAASVRGPDGTPISTLRVPDFGEGLDRMLAVRRSVLHEVLFSAVVQQPAIRVRLGSEVTETAADSTVMLRSGKAITGDLVVGCDGVSSAVRASGDFGARVRSTGHVYLRGLVPRSEPGFEGEYWSASGIFGGAPVDSETQYFYASATAPAVRGAIAARDRFALRRVWGAEVPAAAPVFDAVRHSDDLLVNDVVRVDCTTWHDGRRVLLGDAAHAMSPTAGQGANSALVDAAVLVAELSAAGSPAEGLDRYTLRRRPAVLRVQDQADRLARAAHLRGSLARRVRDGLLRTLDRRQGLAEHLVRAAQQEDPAALRSEVSALRPASPAAR
jgi:2-polyprenyl-6-methoxyphenol hydroxylase-like FAD-dependent oxidoreductase